MITRTIGGVLQATLLVAAFPALSQTQRIHGYASGIVNEVSPEGDILLENGQKLLLWGLELADIDVASILLEDQQIGCAIIEETSTAFVSDCVLFPQREGVLRSTYRLDLFTWLGEFGAYFYACQDEELPNQIKEHVNNHSYWCAEGGIPKRTSRARLD